MDVNDTQAHSNRLYRNCPSDETVFNAHKNLYSSPSFPWTPERRMKWRCTRPCNHALGNVHLEGLHSKKERHSSSVPKFFLNSDKLLIVRDVLSI